ncbi:ubiquinone/menaquinone biosynthesis C-methylase UbiE [Shimia isoporae]|uniref:Ubiquinone/menaquinone biosynthesis C-methylase UbiE n=1 Tax=Shimia isoporae TaxID=647720 RepID=A0A4R1NAV2_9RHOB|nr:methyltransferase domain-containing protein [Shimia isoporae]TCL00546.1 ubiquinone/menaquinone biosynthesis C-methylase UbiE [Shimia isoporae]
MTSSATFWDKHARSYAKSPIGDMPAYEYTLGRTRSYLKTSDHALEIGAGTGSTAIKLSDAVKHLTVTDISGEMLEIGKERAAEAGVSNVSFVRAVASNAPEGPFDVVMAHNLLHLVDDLEADLADIAWRVKSGGLFISKTPCIAEQGLGLKFGLLKAAIPLMQLFGKAPFVRYLKVAELEGLIAEAGFDIIETGNFPVRPPSRYIVARKR